MTTAHKHLKGANSFFFNLYNSKYILSHWFVLERMSLLDVFMETMERTNVMNLIGHFFGSAWKD